VYLENVGHYQFRPYAFSIARGSQWNVMAEADLQRDGWPGVIIGAMRLKSITQIREPGDSDISPACCGSRFTPLAAKH